MKNAKCITLYMLLIFNVLQADPPTWVVDPASYEYNMSLTGVIIFQDIESEDPNDMIGAFVDDVCRGVAQPTLFPPTGRYTFGMTIYSNKGGEVISFQAYDASEDTTYKMEQEQVFESNAVVGDDMNPVEFTTYIPKYSLTMKANPPEGGTTDPPEGGYLYEKGTVVEITSTPTAKYSFVMWSGDVWDPHSAITSVTMDTNKIITANFELITYDLNIAVDPANAGTTQPSVGTYEITTDSLVSLLAQPAANFRFLRWEGDVEDPHDSSTTILVNSDKTIKAIFEEKPPQRCVLTIKIDPPQAGTTDPAAGEHEIDMGTEVMVKATAAANFEFSKWIGDVSDADDATTTINMDQSKTITAVFKNISSVETGDDSVPDHYTLRQNYPNPFNSSTVITFSIPVSAPIRLEIVDVHGKRIKVLKDGVMAQGQHSVVWSGRDTQDNEVPSGLYLYRLNAEDYSKVRKLLYVK